MPGYVSLFEKHQSPPPGSRKSLSDSLDLENLLEGDVDCSDAESMGESDLESVLNAKINGTA